MRVVETDAQTFQGQFLGQIAREARLLPKLKPVGVSNAIGRGRLRLASWRRRNAAVCLESDCSDLGEAEGAGRPILNSERLLTEPGHKPSVWKGWLAALLFAPVALGILLFPGRALASRTQQQGPQVTPWYRTTMYQVQDVVGTTAATVEQSLATAPLPSNYALGLTAAMLLLLTTTLSVAHKGQAVGQDADSKGSCAEAAEGDMATLVRQAPRSEEEYIATAEASLVSSLQGILRPNVRQILLISHNKFAQQSPAQPAIPSTPTPRPPHARPSWLQRKADAKVPEGGKGSRVVVNSSANVVAVPPAKRELPLQPPEVGLKAGPSVTQGWPGVGPKAPAEAQAEEVTVAEPASKSNLSGWYQAADVVAAAGAADAVLASHVELLVSMEELTNEALKLEADLANGLGDDAAQTLPTWVPKQSAKPVEATAQVEATMPVKPSQQASETPSAHTTAPRTRKAKEESSEAQHWDDPVGDLLKALKLEPMVEDSRDPVSHLLAGAKGWTNVRSQYDVLQDFLSMEAPTIRSKYDPWTDLREVSAPKGDDFVKFLLTVDAPTGNAKFDVIQALLSVEAPTNTAEYDFIKNLKGLEPSALDSHFDILSVLKDIHAPTGVAEHDFVKGLRNMEVLQDAKFDIVKALTSAEAPTEVGEHDVVKALRNWEVPSGTAKHDVIKALKSAASPSTQSNFDIVNAILSAQPPSGVAEFDVIKNLANLQAPTAASNMDLVHWIRNLQAPKGGDKFNPLKGLANAEAPAGGSNLDLVHWLRHVQPPKGGEKFDLIKGMARAEAPKGDDYNLLKDLAKVQLPSFKRKASDHKVNKPFVLPLGSAKSEEGQRVNLYGVVFKRSQDKNAAQQVEVPKPVEAEG